MKRKIIEIQFLDHLLLGLWMVSLSLVRAHSNLRLTAEGAPGMGQAEPEVVFCEKLSNLPAPRLFPAPGTEQRQT